MSAALLVADSGPLIALARLGLLSLPAKLFDEMLVCAAVWHEVSRQPQPDELDTLLAARSRGWLTVVDDPSVVPMALAQLDMGERASIALALDMRAIVLLDERKGRKTAAKLGLDIIGILGLLIRAREMGIVERVRPLVERLQGSGYYLAPGLIDHALAAIGE